MASTVITPIAQAIANVAGALAVTPVVKDDLWAPKQLTGSGPFAVVELPDFTRTPLGERESQLGHRDWLLEYPVTFYFDMREAKAAQGRAAEVIEAFIKAVDANVALGTSGVDFAIEESRVTTGEVSYDTAEAARPLLAFETVVSVLAFVP